MKNINKITAAVMALAMVSAIAPMSAFATDIDQAAVKAGNNTGTMNVTYSVDPTYTVTIPASVTLGEDKPISVSNVNLATGKKIVVKLTDAKNKALVSGSEFTVATDDTTPATATYQVKKGTTVLALNDTAYEFAYDGTTKTGSGTLTFTEPTDAKFAGTYADQLTFTISVE
jgi:hypothetical protein